MIFIRITIRRSSSLRIIQGDEKNIAPPLDRIRRTDSRPHPRLANILLLFPGLLLYCFIGDEAAPRATLSLPSYPRGEVEAVLYSRAVLPQLKLFGEINIRRDTWTRSSRVEKRKGEGQGGREVAASKSNGPKISSESWSIGWPPPARAPTLLRGFARLLDVYLKVIEGSGRRRCGITATASRRTRPTTFMSV